jgi:nucleoside-diphosphate-sugar epimerase
LAAASDALIGQTVNIAFGRAVSVAEMADLVLAALRRNDLGRQMLPERPGDVHHLHADTRKAERMLGYKAAIGIEEGIAKYIDWVRSTYPDPSALLDTQLTNWVEPTQPERSHA